MEKDTCAAALLNIFEYWANAAIAAVPTIQRPWVGTRPIREFEQMLLGISTDKQIRQRLALLEQRGYIQVKAPARRGAAKAYRVMIPEIQQALVAQMTEECSFSRSAGHITDEREASRSFNREGTGQTTDEAAVKQPTALRSNDRALKKSFKEFKKEDQSRSALSFEKRQTEPEDTSSLNRLFPDQVSTVTNQQPPETIDFSELWETNPGLAKMRLRALFPEHRRLEMLAHGFGNWWIGPGLNDFDEHLIQACRNRKRKFQQPDGLGDAKGYINNMLRNGDWGNFALRCEEAKALKEKMSATSSLTQTASTVSTRSNPFKRSEQERRDSALGLARFKVAQGEIERGREISRQFGFSIAEIGLSADVADVTVRHPCSSQAA